MRIIEAIILGFIQGLTEFFPVSSSGHLLLAPVISESLGVPLDFSLADNQLDLILHIATYFALIILYRKQIIELFTKFNTKRIRNLWKNLIITTIPICLVGVIFIAFDLLDDRQPVWISIITLILVGVWLIWIDQKTPVNTINGEAKGESYKVIDQISSYDALKIGLYQATATIRGVSRSGIALIGGLNSNLSKQEALDYAFLISLPVFTILTGAEILSVGLDLIGGENLSLSASPIEVAIASITAFLTALAAIKLFKDFINRRGILTAFGVYRIILAAIVAIIVFA